MHAKVRKIKISNGIYWVEFPDADFYVLCGCPADAVKHLLKRGMIESVTRNGVTFETGPNAILLSDVLRQNGSFANLTEFPVLQMLYRQGMILPNHPNNTGQKPMLIGHPAQVKSQLNYIYRGNYGLISKEELLEAGASETEADEMMRVKLRFAFGKITSPDNFLDTCTIKHRERIEIRDGIFLERLGLNEYRFEYEGDTVEVDLNLAKGENYLPSYKLSYHSIPRDYFSVVHSGEGDGWDINRPCMASILIFQGKIYLIDAGPNVLASLNFLGISANEIEGIFHTHAHDDHFAGLTTLIRTDRRFKYFATPVVRAAVTKKLCALMGIEEGRFSEFFHIHDLPFDKWTNVEGLEVKPVYSPHPVETNIYFFRTGWENGYKTYAHLADVVSERTFRDMISDEPSKEGISPERFREVMECYRTPVDLKKVDVGGGLIHGDAKDYIGDKSEKLVLAHTSDELTLEQKKIGSAASFGMVDVLVSASSDYLIEYARTHLRFYFPEAPEHEINHLLNYPVRSFNAGTMLLREQQPLKDVYLLLTGSVEFSDPQTGSLNTFPAGSLIGFYSGYLGLHIDHSYWAASNINVLQLPAQVYHEFVKRNRLYDTLKRLEENILFLEKTWLFGEIVSFPILTRIAQQMRYQSLRKGTTERVENDGELRVLIKGKLQLHAEGKPIEVLRNG
ncbi:MAG: MBL fold metallo-hydrolase, partial [Bacteroidota bacterium]